MKNINTFNWYKFKFKEGLYTDGDKIYLMWYSNENEVINFTDAEASPHSSIYKIAFHCLLGTFVYVGEL